MLFRSVKVEKETETEAETERDPVADFVDPVWSGTLVYRALIPKAALDRRWPGHRAGLGPVCVSVFFCLSFFFPPFSFCCFLFAVFFCCFLSQVGLMLMCVALGLS